MKNQARMIAILLAALLLFSGCGTPETPVTTEQYPVGSVAYVTDPNQLESGASSGPAQQNEMILVDTGEGNYIGFTLDGWSLPDRNGGMYNKTLKRLAANRQPDSQTALNPEALGEVYTQYFSITPEGEKFCVEILDRDGLSYWDYFVFYEPELVKEGTLQELDTVWLLIKGTPNDYNNPEDTYHLFCHSEALRCTLVVSSNRSFERCEEALSHLTLVDSGAPIRREVSTFYPMRLPELPEGFEIYWDFTDLQEDSMFGNQLMDPETDLSGLYSQLALIRPTDGLWISLYVYPTFVDFERTSGFQLIRTGTLNGREARWYEVRGESCLICLYEDGPMLFLSADRSGAEVEALLEALALQVELVSIDVLRGEHTVFAGFAEG